MGKEYQNGTIEEVCTTSLQNVPKEPASARPSVHPEGARVVVSVLPPIRNTLRAMAFIMTEDQLFSAGRQNRGQVCYGTKVAEVIRVLGKSPCNKTPLQTGGIATAPGLSMDHLSTESFSVLSVSKKSLYNRRRLGED